jgi:choline dehydrogenase
MNKRFDYVILGAGSAGCVMFRRLKDKGLSVCLLEAGPSDRGPFQWNVRMPAALTYSISSTKNNWDYHTVPQKHLNNRKLHQPRGRVLGGSSSINAMVYMRGNPWDYDNWARITKDDSWRYNNILKYFMKSQNYYGEEIKEGTTHKIPSYRSFYGKGGPLNVKSYNLSNTTNELSKVFCMAGMEAGYPLNLDINCPISTKYNKVQEGVGPFDMTINPDGTRCSTSSAYLYKNQDLLSDIFTNTLVNNLLVKDDKVIGVNTTKGNFYANKEVISCLGAVGSPELLLKSKELLTRTKCLLGEGLQDHLEVYLQYKCKKPISLFPISSWTSTPYGILKRISIGAEWFLFGTGICASNQFEVGGFVKNSNELGTVPNIQFHFIPGIVNGQLETLRMHGFQLHVGTLRPKSRGRIYVENGKVCIDPNYLSVESDMDDMVDAVEIGKNIINQKAFDEYRGPPLHDLSNKEKIKEFIRSTAQSGYHLSCSLPMQKSVDSNGLFKEIHGLRVVDASIMPNIVSSNLNAPVIMMAEKISDSIENNFQCNNK